MQLVAKPLVECNAFMHTQRETVNMHIRNLCVYTYAYMYMYVYVYVCVCVCVSLDWYVCLWSEGVALDIRPLDRHAKITFMGAGNISEQFRCVVNSELCHRKHH